MTPRPVVVVDYDPAWPAVFEQLRAHVWPAVRHVAVSIEHVGSTAVPALAAKPVIDMSIVVPAPADVAAGVACVTTLGYIHEGEMGVEGREAFRAPAGSPAHNLYLCPTGSLGLVNQVAVRDYLRAHPETARKYGELKKLLALQFPNDIEGYVAGKTDVVLEILKRAGVSADRLEAIERANRRS